MSTPRCLVCAVKVKKGFHLCYRCGSAINTYCVTEGRNLSFQEGIEFANSMEVIPRIKWLQEWYEYYQDTLEG